MSAGRRAGGGMELGDGVSERVGWREREQRRSSPLARKSRSRFILAGGLAGWASRASTGSDGGAAAAGSPRLSRISTRPPSASASVSRSSLSSFTRNDEILSLE